MGVRGNAGGDPGIAWSRAHDSEPTRRPTDEEGRGYARELAGTRRPSPSSTWWLLAGRPDVHAIKKRAPDRGPTKVAEFPRLAQYSRLRANFNFARGSATTPTQRLNGLGPLQGAMRVPRHACSSNPHGCGRSSPIVAAGHRLWHGFASPATSPVRSHVRSAAVSEAACGSAPGMSISSGSNRFPPARRNGWRRRARLGGDRLRTSCGRVARRCGNPR